MSRAKAFKDRVPGEAYYTPSWCVRRMLEALSLPPGAWLEPAVGNGSIVRAVNEVRGDIEWHGCDISPSVVVCHRYACPVDVREFKSQVPSEWPSRYSVLLTNPPFSLAEDFLRLGLQVANKVVLLLPLKWLESAERSGLLDKNMPDVFVLPNRPSFADGKTDVTAYAWMHWDSRNPRSHGTIERLAITPLEERKRR